MILHTLLDFQQDPGKNPSLKKLCGEKPSGENPSNFSGGENPLASFATCGEKLSLVLGHVEKSPQFSKKPPIFFNSI